VRFNKSGLIALIIVAAIALLCILAPVIAPYNPAEQLDITDMKSLAPSLSHPLGTDIYSRDLLSRILYGGRISLMVAALATIITIMLGTTYGAIAGYAGGIVDSAMMRLVDAFLSIPRLLLLIAVAAAWRQLPLWILITILGVTGWFGLSRLVRGQVLAIRERDYVQSARALGAGNLRILFRHILPNVSHLILVEATLGVGHVIVLEAGLSFLGIGVQQPAASWGNIIQDGSDQLMTAWWISLFPGLAIAITATAINLLGDSLRDAYDRRGYANA
jgi:peptide/nickel transport system permease protein